jgi:cell division protein FtsB
MIRAVQAFLLPTALGIAILYFSYHALAGDQGLRAWTELQKQETLLKADLLALELQRAELEASLARLRDDTLDLDYVDELARTKLSYVRADEVIVTVR